KNNTENVANERNNISKILIKSPKLIYKILNKKIINYLNKDIINIRTNKFKKFTLDYIKETHFMILDDNIIDTLSDRYDYFVTGSDQVWNPDYLYGTSINF